MLNNFCYTPQEYSQEAFKIVQKRLKTFRRTFYTLNTTTLILGLISTIITILTLSKQVRLFLDQNDKVPDWYFFVIASFSAIGTLSSGIINFFVIRDKIKTYNNKSEDIKTILVDYENKISSQYQNKASCDYFLFVNIALVMDNDLKRKEIIH